MLISHYPCTTLEHNRIFLLEQFLKKYRHCIQCLMFQLDRSQFERSSKQCTALSRLNTQCLHLIAHLNWA